MSDSSDAATPPAKRRVWPWIVALAVVVLGGGYWWLGGDDDDEGEPATRTATVGYRQLGDLVTAAGKLKPSAIVEVGAQVSGQLHRLHVQVGDRVAAGDLLAEIDATIQRNLVKASRASVESQEAALGASQSALRLAEAEAERQRRLMAENATTAVALERAEDALVRARSNLAGAQARTESSRANLTSEEAKLGYANIYAPADGTVLQLIAAEGQTLTATYVTPVILHLADLSTMTVEAKVAEANIGKLTVGMGAYFTTLGGRDRRWRGTLRQVMPRAVVEANVATYTALFDVDNADGALLADMSAQVFFEISEPRRILAVPLDMVSDFARNDAGRMTGEVNLLGADGVAAPRRITIGETSHTHAEVLEGLVEGNRVVAL